MLPILITGSEGLIGKSLAEHLALDGFNVIRFDKKIDNQDVNHFNHNANYSGIIHLAAVSRVIWGENDPELCWQTNVEGTRNVLESALSSPHKPWVIYASSREVYGQQEKLPVTESALLQPMNIYARSKVAAENLVAEYQLRGLNAVILRFSSVYGSTDDHADRVIPAFCKAAALGKTLKVEGLGNILDFTHISDVINAIMKVIHKLQENQTLPTLHITTGQPTTLQKAAELALEFSQKAANFVEAPSRNYDVSTFYGDPHLAKTVLNWEPKINITRGISQMVNAYYENS